MHNFIQIQLSFLILFSIASCNGQNHTDGLNLNENPEESESIQIPYLTKTDTLYFTNAPNSITRAMIQDKAGNIWFATFEGIIKYDGNSFTNITKEISQSRFFSVLEDGNNQFWLGTIGSGVYRYYNGSFRNFTTDDGLINNEIVFIYEDKTGNIWFGANGGASMYDGTRFRNYLINGNSIIEDRSGAVVPNLQRPSNEVNTIVEDNTGNFWFGTRGNAFLYDGTSFKTIRHNGRPFKNVRTIIKDRNDNIWLGGNDGLWCYDGHAFTNFKEQFVGYIYEDTKGNIWTSSEGTSKWSLSKYHISESTIVDKNPTEIKTGEGMFFGILEDADGNIWAGTLNGVYRYNGHTIEYFENRM